MDDLDDETEQKEKVDKERYQRHFGKLIYLSHIRLYIMFEVTAASQYMSDPRKKVLEISKRYSKERVVLPETRTKND